MHWEYRAEVPNQLVKNKFSLFVAFLQSLSICLSNVSIPSILITKRWTQGLIVCHQKFYYRCHFVLSIYHKWLPLDKRSLNYLDTNLDSIYQLFTQIFLLFSCKTYRIIIYKIKPAYFFCWKNTIIYEI